jgi:hypothetical protein
MGGVTGPDRNLLLLNWDTLIRRLGVILYIGTIVVVSRRPTERDDNRARKSTGTATSWSPGGVQRPNFRDLASNWRPNLVELSLVFSVNGSCK